MMGLKSDAVARDPAARHRGGRAPRLPRARLSRRRTLYGAWQPSSHRSPSICRAAKRAARALARIDTRRQGRGAGGDRRGAARRACEEILAANERDMQLGARERTSATRCSTACASTRGASRRSPRAVRQIAALRRPGRRGDRRPAPAQRPRRAQGARAARRRRGRLRGAPERHDRRRRAVPEVGQRDRPARLLLGARTPTPRSPQIAAEAAVAAGLPDGLREPRRRRRARGAGRAGDAEDTRRPDHPARRRGPEGRRCRRSRPCR